MSYEAAMDFCTKNNIPVYVIPNSNLVAANVNSWTTVVGKTVEEVADLYKSVRIKNVVHEYAKKMNKYA